MAKLPTNFDWRRSPRHISYLAHFKNPNAGKYSDAEYMIKESADSAIERFVRDGALIICGLPEKVAHKFRVPELKEVLKRHGQKVSGGKPELVAAAIAVAGDELEAATTTLKLYHCTPLGLAAIDELEREQADAKSRAQAEANEHLLAGNAKSAYAVFVAFQRRYSDVDYSGSSNQVEKLQFVLESAPKVIGHLEADAWRSLRAATGMKVLWREDAETAWLPDSFHRHP